MRQLRFLAFAVLSFVAALLGTLLSPSTWLHKSLAVALCGVLSADPALCTSNAIVAHSQEASATNPVNVETTQFSDLLAQRLRDFDDDTPKSPPRPSSNNPKPTFNRNDSGANIPVRRPDFDDSPSTPTNINSSSNFSNNDKSNIVLRRKTFRGCEVITNTSKNNGVGDKLSLLSVEYLSNNQKYCGQSFIIKFSQNFDRIEINLSNGEKSVLENLNQNDKIYFVSFDAQGRSSRLELRIPDEIRQIANNINHYDYIASKTKNGKVCEVIEEYCKNMDKVSTNLGMIQLAVALGGLAGTPLTAGASAAGAVTVEIFLEMIELGLNVAQLPCFVYFGGNPPIPFGKLFKILSRATKLPVNIFESKKISSFISKSMSGSGKFMGDTVGDPELASAIKGIASAISDGLQDQTLEHLIDKSDAIGKYLNQFNPPPDKELSLREQNRNTLTENFFRGVGSPFSPICEDKKDREILTQNFNRVNTEF